MHRWCVWLQCGVAFHFMSDLSRVSPAKWLWSLISSTQEHGNCVSWYRVCHTGIKRYGSIDESNIQIENDIDHWSYSCLFIVSRMNHSDIFKYSSSFVFSAVLTCRAFQFHLRSDEKHWILQPTATCKVGNASTVFRCASCTSLFGSQGMSTPQWLIITHYQI